MEKTPLLPLPEGMLIDQIQITATGLVIAVVATHPTACCPLCAFASSAMHSHYRRVQLCLTVRKFYCRNPLCERKITTRAPAPVC